MRRGNCLERAAEAILRCSHDVLQEELGSGHFMVLRFKRGISIVLRRRKDYQSSEQLIQQALSDSETHNGHLAEETRNLLWRLANLYTQQQRYVETERAYVEALSRGFAYAMKQGRSPDEASIRILQEISGSGQLPGRQYRSTDWARHEVNVALQRKGSVQVRAMLAQAGYAQVTRSGPDEACLRQVSDLTEVTKSVWSVAKWPGTT